ncbi:hypothetical protein [Candidatus Amarobacter glycogenicus]|uniref:hypothetical protein n=1 Tax=Candidatus Amarobacter glycogenicus TaxID=3140699 RepID=UPI003134F88E|nr:hypothetical protein [Dehalococcoidia bacterium]
MPDVVHGERLPVSKSGFVGGEPTFDAALDRSLFVGGVPTVNGSVSRSLPDGGVPTD